MSLTSLVLPIALGVVMLSLGLSLKTDDFRRVLLYPRAVVVALLCQTVLLPLVCFGLVQAFGLPAELCVGLMLLAASPGGAFANVLSHLGNGDLALNITLTAINSVLSIITLPLILGLSLAFFMDDGRVIPPQFSKIVQVFVMIVGPVVIGMLLRWRFDALAHRLDKPVRIFAALFLLLVAAMAIQGAWPTIVQYFAELGAAVITFCVISLAVGYWAPRLVRLDHRQSLAISMEIGMHNGALAITIALSPMILNSPQIAAAPSMYAVLSLFIAVVFMLLVRALHRRSLQ